MRACVRACIYPCIPRTRSCTHSLETACVHVRVCSLLLLYIIHLLSIHHILHHIILHIAYIVLCFISRTSNTWYYFGSVWTANSCDIVSYNETNTNETAHFMCACVINSYYYYISNGVYHGVFPHAFVAVRAAVQCSIISYETIDKMTLRARPICSQLS